MHNNYLLKKGLRIQVLGWPVYFLFIWLLNKHLFPERTLTDLFMTWLLFFVVFNLVAAVLYMLLLTSYRWAALLFLVLLFFFSSELVYVVVYRLFPLLGINLVRDHSAEAMELFPWRMVRLYAVVVFMAGGLVLHLRSIRYYLQKIKEKELRHQKELEARESKMAFLLAQINPHFLYNVLNNIRQEADEALPSVADSLERLSSLLRYMIENASQEIKKVVIEREIAQLRAYIDLERSRFEHCFVRLLMSGEPCGQKLPPLLLITLMENAFKYGRFDDPRDPIEVELVLGDETIRFSCINRIDHAKRRQEPGGLGLLNVRQRLEMLFPNQYTLEIKELESGHFEVILTISQ